MATPSVETSIPFQNPLAESADYRHRHLAISHNWICLHLAVLRPEINMNSGYCGLLTTRKCSWPLSTRETVFAFSEEVLTFYET